MNPDQWARVKDVFHAALERTPADRAAFVHQACDGDTGVASEVERLLSAHDEATRFIEQSPVAAGRSSLTGEVFGRYEIGRLIGVGGMGEVYAARDVELKRDVAIKIGLAGGADPRLRREAQHASQLNHPHICTIYEVGSHDGDTYIVMEYVDGRRLQDLIPQEGCAADTVVRYGIQIADALAHAHQQGVIHRDLKPANVVVTPDGRAKVLDFGLARATAAARLTSASEAPVTATGLVTGTPAYMAPELLRGAQADIATDVWALGVVLYEMASGVRPFAGATGFEVTSAILHEPPAPLPARVPPALQQIVRRCLSKEPLSRYRRADEVRAALEVVQLDADNRTPQSHPAPQAVPVARAWWLRAGVAVVLLAVIAAGATWAWRRVVRETPVAVGAAGRPAIAVMAFEDLAGGPDTAWLSQGVPSMLLTGLAQTRGLDIVSAQRLNEVVRQLGGSSLASLPRDQVAEVGRRAGAGAIVVGGIFKAGSQIRLDAQIEDLVSGRVLAAESVRGTDLFLMVDELAARIRDDIGFQSATDIRKVSDISTTSLEAFQLYLQGVDAYFNYRYAEARPQLERAAAIDPGFAEAYLRLANVNFFLGLYGEQRAYLEKAAQHRDRLSARQRLTLDTELARADGDAARASRSLDELIAAFPDDEDAYNIAFQLYAPVTGLIVDPQKLLATETRAKDAVPRSLLTRNLYAYALLYTGRHAEAVREFEENVRIGPSEPNPHDSLGEAYLVTGAPDRAVESYARASALDPAFTGPSVGRPWGLAMMGRYDEALADRPPNALRAFLLSRAGRYRESAQALDAAMREAEMAGSVDEQGQLHLLSALIAIERKEYARALQACAAAERVLSQLPVPRQRVRLVVLHLLQGIAELKAGRTELARQHLDAQAPLVNATVVPENAWRKALEGEIALAAGDTKRAGAAFAAGKPAGTMWFETLRMSLTIQANSLLSRDGLARVAKAQGDPARAVAIYRQLLSFGPDHKYVSVFEPRYVLEIARLLNASGDKAGALEEYRRFLDLWKGADSGLPELAEARVAVQRLS